MGLDRHQNMWPIWFSAVQNSKYLTVEIRWDMGVPFWAWKAWTSNKKRAKKKKKNKQTQLQNRLIAATLQELKSEEQNTFCFFTCEFQGSKQTHLWISKSNLTIQTLFLFLFNSCNKRSASLQWIRDAMAGNALSTLCRYHHNFIYNQTTVLISFLCYKFVNNIFRVSSSSPISNTSHYIHYIIFSTDSLIFSSIFC